MKKVLGVDDRAPLTLSLVGEHGFDNVLDIVQLTKDDISNLTYTVMSYHRIAFSLILLIDADLSPILWIFGSLFLVTWIVNNY